MQVPGNNPLTISQPITSRYLIKLFLIYLIQTWGSGESQSYSLATVKYAWPGSDVNNLVWRPGCGSARLLLTWFHWSLLNGRELRAESSQWCPDTGNGIQWMSPSCSCSPLMWTQWYCSRKFHFCEMLSGRELFLHELNHLTPCLFTLPQAVMFNINMTLWLLFTRPQGCVSSLNCINASVFNSCRGGTMQVTQWLWTQWSTTFTCCPVVCSTRRLSPSSVHHHICVLILADVKLAENR